MKFDFKKLGDFPATFECKNDIQDVIDGKKPENPDSLWLNTDSFSQGLGNGAIKNINSLGESIIINGVAYVKSTYQAASDYYKLAAGKKFMTSWIFLIRKEVKPSYQISADDKGQRCKVIDIYQAIYEKIKVPFVVSGVINFANLKAAAIAKAPILCENIFEHKETYYPYKIDLKNVSGAIVEVAANLANVNENLGKKLKKVVYYNPLEIEAGRLTTHEHILILNKIVKAIEEVSQIDATDVQHLFTDSEVNSFNLNIYTINEIVLC